MRPLRALIPLFLLIAAGCERTEMACACATYAVSVDAEDKDGRALVLDSLHYVWGTDSLQIQPTPNETYLNLGLREGLYRLVAFYRGQASDTARVEVRMGGPAHCRTLSTQLVRFTFPDTARPTSLTRQIGGCGQKTE